MHEGDNSKPKWKRLYEEKIGVVRKKISMAKAELERLNKNRKLTMRGKRNRVIFKRECKSISLAELVSYKEKQKSAVRKMKKGFCKRKKQEEARLVNRQFYQDARRVYANMKKILSKDDENERPKYTGNNKLSEVEKFDNVEEARSFFRKLREGEGTGNNVPRLDETRSRTYSRFSHDVTATMLEPLNKETAAMLEPRPNPPGI